MKRFYKTASAEAREDGHAVLLDGRELKSPAGRPVRLPPPLAAAMAAEWDAPNAEIVTASMPLTGLVFTGLDRVGGNRQAILDELVRHAGTDLLCYRAATPRDLALRQEESWQPILDWASRLGIEMVVAYGVTPIDQPAESLERCRALIEAYDDLRLAGLYGAVTASGSFLLGLALAEGLLDAGQVFEASVLDELHQAASWGEDEEAARRRLGLKAEIAAAGQILEQGRAIR